MKLNDEGPSNAAHWHKRATEAEAELAQARQTAEYWKAEHLAGNARIGELHDELAATALRSADHQREQGRDHPHKRTHACRKHQQ